MSKNRTKGNLTVRKIRAKLVEDNWFSAVTERTGKNLKSKDLFSDYSSADFGFDLIAIHKKKGLKLIQAKTNTKPNIDIYKDFSIKYNYNNISIEIWIYYNRKKTLSNGFVIYSIKNGKQFKTDYRRKYVKKRKI